MKKNILFTVPVIVTTGMELIKAKDILDYGATLFYHKHNINWDQFLNNLHKLLNN